MNNIAQMINHSLLNAEFTRHLEGCRFTAKCATVCVKCGILKNTGVTVIGYLIRNLSS